MQNAVASAWEDGFEKGLEDQAWKDLASKHQQFSDKLCSAWWFDLNHKERTINLEGKPKKW